MTNSRPRRRGCSTDRAADPPQQPHRLRLEDRPADAPEERLRFFGEEVVRVKAGPRPASLRYLVLKLSRAPDGHTVEDACPQHLVCKVPRVLAHQEREADLCQTARA